MEEAYRYWASRIRRSSRSKHSTVKYNADIAQYRSTDFIAPGPGKLQLVYTPADGSAPTTLNVYDFKDKGVALAMYNTDESIRGFAHSSFKMALSKNLPLVCQLSCMLPAIPLNSLPSSCRPKTPFSKSTMADSRTSSRRSTRRNHASSLLSSAH